MMNHATSAVLASNNPSPINAIPTTRSFGSASSSFNSRFSGSIAFVLSCKKITKEKKNHKN